MTKMLISAGVILLVCVSVTSGDPATDENVPEYIEPSVRIMLTKFQITDTELSLEWRIRNETDHDIWYCRGFGNPAIPEDFLAEESSTLKMRSRLNVPIEAMFNSMPMARYVRLLPGEEGRETHLRSVPIRGGGLLAAGRVPEAEQIKRLIVEIGYYNEDLPELIRSILRVAEKFGPDRVDESDFDSVFRRYFSGLMIAQHYDSLALFDELYGETIHQGILPMPYMFQQLSGEQVLRIEVDGLDIPFKR